MIWAEIVDDRISRLSVSDDAEFGAEWLMNNLGGVWLPVDESKPYGRGFTWDKKRKMFIPPQPFPSWGLNETSMRWEPPVPMPSNGGSYNWDEAAGNWSEVTGE